MLKINKISKKVLATNVHGQACGNDCKVKVWAGKREADRSQAGCWYTYQYTARWNPFA
mgnify:FL=1